MGFYSLILKGPDSKDVIFTIFLYAKIWAHRAQYFCAIRAQKLRPVNTDREFIFSSGEGLISCF